MGGIHWTRMRCASALGAQTRGGIANQLCDRFTRRNAERHGRIVTLVGRRSLRELVPPYGLASSDAGGYNRTA